MIKKLILKNWRSYEYATIEFRPGTTFVVASNGVGKTSLVEAARFALFGKIAPDGHAAVRAGAATALAIVELELPDRRVLTVERTLTSKSRGASPSPVVHLDGAPLTPEGLHRLLSGAYRTEPGFLAGLTMPAADRDHDKPSALGLEEHLGRYYGIDGLRTAIDQLTAMRKANNAQIKRTKAANATSAKQLAQLQSDMEQAAHHVTAATQKHKAAQDRLDRAREHERIKADMQQWQNQHAVWTEAVKTLATRISAELGQPITPGSLESHLDEQQADLDQQIETIRVEIAVNEARQATLTANEERLDAAHDDCPICRRPLDDTTVAMAHEANRREVSTIRDAVLELKTREADLLGRRERVKAAQAEWRRIPQPGKPPQESAADEDGPLAAAQLADMAQGALDVLVEARATHVQATREFNDAQAADKAMRELESLFRQEAILTVAVEATEATLTELLDDTIRPLAVEVNQRWKTLFPDRGDLKTTPDGNITRTVNGHPLPYDSFSTGESMSATIILRLLVAQMATTADFCWFDEPLEHLDPDVRRAVANILSRATSGESTLRQVVVTTYEEPLARQLRARDDQRVTLLDVR